jgi:hypothetical protein
MTPHASASALAGFQVEQAVSLLSSIDAAIVALKAISYFPSDANIVLSYCHYDFTTQLVPFATVRLDCEQLELHRCVEPEYCGVPRVAG